MASAVIVEKLSKRYGALSALREVSLRVEEGGFFALLGPNGAGKTTLIGILGGLVKPDSGDAFIQGRSVRDESLAARRLLGIVPQELAYDPFFTVQESLVFQSKYYGIGDNRAWIDTLLERLHLKDKSRVNTRKLSGGMKRRLMIAQALVHRPPVIVLDEPTAGVDIQLRLSLWDFIRDLNRQGHTIILTTHYLEEAQTLCDTVALMRDGEVAAMDKMQSLIACCRDKGQVRLQLAGRVPDTLPPHQKQGNALLFTIDRYEEIENLLALLRQANAVIAEMKVSPPDLEDVFLSLLKKSP